MPVYFDGRTFVPLATATTAAAVTGRRQSDESKHSATHNPNYETPIDMSLKSFPSMTGNH